MLKTHRSNTSRVSIPAIRWPVEKHGSAVKPTGNWRITPYGGAPSHVCVNVPVITTMSFRTSAFASHSAWGVVASLVGGLSQSRISSHGVGDCHNLRRDSTCDVVVLDSSCREPRPLLTRRDGRVCSPDTCRRTCTRYVFNPSSVETRMDSPYLATGVNVSGG